ncbi:PKD-like domain-containing protein [Pedobacter ginsengisoli]|uniref:Ig-like domain-containing protein n=1 Tax=Pedobacter ginsengisoli TaxID=363852 RepID=UPI00254D4D00|nr:PKD-like domain-containing protein [Pedobacter ginsengisoli]
MVLGGSSARGQTPTYATGSDDGVSGICLLCGVNNPNRAASTSSLTDFSDFTVTLGLGSVSVYQTLIFPSVNTQQGCDEVVVHIGNSSNVLTANLLTGVSIGTWNGSTSNNDAITINSATLTLLGGGNEAEIRFKPTAKFDRVRVTLSSALLSANLGTFRLYFAYKTAKIPSLATISSQSICDGQSFDLTSINPADNNNYTGGSYTWSTMQGGSAISTTVTPPVGTTTYWVRYTKDACYDDKSFQITVKPLPTFTSSLTSSVCSGSTFSYSAIGGISGTTFSWTRAVVSGISNASGTGNSNSISETLINTTSSPKNVTYVFNLTANGCSSSFNLVVTVNPQPSLASITSQSTCVGQSINLTTLNPTDQTGTSGGTYIWSLTQGGAALPSTTITGSAGTYTYWVRYAKDGCYSDQSASVTFNTIPATPSVSAPSICTGSYGVFSIISPVVGYVYNWYTASTGGSPIATGTTYTTPGALSSTVTFFVEGVNGTCPSATRGAVTITVNPKPPSPHVNISSN